MLVVEKTDVRVVHGWNYCLFGIYGAINGSQICDTLRSPCFKMEWFKNVGGWFFVYLVSIMNCSFGGGNMLSVWAV